MSAVELRRDRSTLVGSIVWTLISALVLGLAFIMNSVVAAVVLAVAGLLGLAVGLAMIRDECRPFRCGIGPDGLTIRTSHLHRTVAWTEISALVVDRLVPSNGAESGARLVLVPEPRSDLATHPARQTVPDGRSGIVVLAFDTVKQNREQVTRALRAFGGDRLVEVDAEGQSAIGTHDFTVVLRGYDRAHVDGLIRRAGAALRSEHWHDRVAVRSEIEAGMIPVELRGYDRGQVDRALQTVAAQLATAPPAGGEH